jgi:hypothetical protein
MSDPYGSVLLTTNKGNTMPTLMTIPVSILEDEDTKVCVFCDTLTDTFYCATCQEYKGLMTISEWETYTGEKWED